MAEAYLAPADTIAAGTTGFEGRRHGLRTVCAAARARFPGRLRALFHYVALSDQELKERLAQHAQFLAAGGCKPEADGAVDIQKPETHRAGDTTLGRASFFRANLAKADFSNTDLRCAEFVGANLTGANFFGSDLRGALFNRANLERANLERTDFRGARLYEANMAHAIYQPVHAAPPSSLALAANLNNLTYNDDPTPLYTAKNQFKERGYADAHRDVIAALRRSHPPEDTLAPEMIRLRNWAGHTLQYLLFDVPAEFGSNPMRPLALILVLWALCGAIYSVAIVRTGKAGLFVVSTGERIPKGKKTPRVFRMRVKPEERGRARRWLHALSGGLFFSFRRTFHFGFKELDFGNWLKLLQSREFDIRAYGWPRVLSGAQSIISIYLLALAILSAFATPFDL